jgi:hypothetical protein
MPLEDRLAMGSRASRLFAASYDMRTHGRDIAVLMSEASQPESTQLPTPASAVK